MSVKYVSDATRQSLISRIKNPEDAQSWNEFFRIYGPMISHQALSAGLPEVLAGEVVQNVLISVARSIPSFRADPQFGSFRNWLFKLTKWRIEDARKQARRQPVSLADAGIPGRRPEETATTPEALLPDPGPWPSEMLDLAWQEDWEEAVRTRTLELFRREIGDPKKYQIFVEYVLRGARPLQVARNFNVSIAQVYLVKNRLGSKYRAARQKAEAEAEKPSVPGLGALAGPVA